MDSVLVVNMPEPLYFRERQLEPTAQEAGWAPGPVSRAVEIGFDPQTVHLVATDYTDYAIPAYFSVRYKLNFYIQCRLLLVFERLKIIIILSTLKSFKRSLPSGFLSNFPLEFPISLTRATCPADLILLGLITPNNT